MRILFVSSRFPLPIRKGDQVILYERIKYFCAENTVELICYGKSIGNLKVLEDMGVVVHLIEFNYFSAAISVLVGICRLMPLQVSIYSQRRFRKKLMELTKSRSYDVIHVMLLRMVGCLPTVYTKNVFVDYVDSMALNFEQTMDTRPKYLRPIFQMERLLIQRFEKSVSKMFHGSVVSERDRGYFLNENISVAKNGVDTDLFKPATVKNKYVIFSGNMSYGPNIAAVKYIIPVINKIRLSHPDFKLKVVGKGASESLRKLFDTNNVCYSGEVENIALDISNAYISVAPVFHASGIQNKALEAMSSGLPVVMSSKVQEPIGCIDDESCIIANTFDEYHHKILELIENEDKRLHIGKNARLYTLKYFGWNASNRVVLNAYHMIGNS